MRFTVRVGEKTGIIGAADVAVLLQGEIGVDKEVLARQLCSRSQRQ